MADTVVTKLATNSRFQMAFILLAVAISLAVGLTTEKLGASGMVLGLSSIVLGLCKYRHERSLNR